MKIALTGATGFIGRYMVREFLSHGHELRCWRRTTSDLSGFDDAQDRVEWLTGKLGDRASAARLVSGCDAVVHGALARAGAGFMGAEGEILDFVETNVLGSLRLIEEARKAGVARFVFISTCAVQDVILDDRPLDEAHPLWPQSHYGAHKAAIEKFVHSYGLGQGYPICALRPTGVYGVNHPIEDSKWFDWCARSFAGSRSRAIAAERKSTPPTWPRPRIYSPKRRRNASPGRRSTATTFTSRNGTSPTWRKKSVAATRRFKAGKLPPRIRFRPAGSAPWACPSADASSWNERFANSWRRRAIQELPETASASGTSSRNFVSSTSRTPPTMSAT
jgi:NAD(P)-dependent dehydrogenase (short-subunit alcohol dehydrogenase family)